MHAWEQIQLAVDELEKHLGEALDIEALAKKAQLSPFYFQRLFKRLVKKPVAEYVKLRRLAIATDMLRQTNQRILDIAVTLGFATHEHFSRTFKESFGLTPEAYRRNPLPLNRMTKPQLLLNYTMVDENVPLITEGIVLEIGRRQLEGAQYYLGLTAQTPVQFIEGLGVESGVDPLDTLWRAFHDLKSALHQLEPGGEELGASFPSEKAGYFCYFAGGRARSAEAVAGCQSWQLPAGQYIVCTFEAENFEQLVMDALYKAQAYLFDVWLPGHKLSTENFCAERYAAHTPETTQMEIWVKIASTEECRRL